jgi:IS5 family transposase
MVLRLLVLKHIRNWSYEVLEREVRANLVYRDFTHVGGGKTPDAKTMGRWGLALGPEVLKQVHAGVVRIARDKGVTAGRRMRVDTTVVETDIHHPTDSTLLGDGVRVLTRIMRRITTMAGTAGTKLRDRTRSVKLRLLEIGRVARAKGPINQDKLAQRYRQLLDTTSRVVGQARRFSGEIAQGMKRSANALKQLVLEGLRQELDEMTSRVRQVMKQTRARIFRGNTRSEEKLLSLFEPSTEVIRKGKAGKPNEFGKMVKLQEAENQIITDYEVYARRPHDSDLLIAAIETHQALLGRTPRLVAADAAFYSAKNEAAARAKGVKRVCIPQPLNQEPRTQTRAEKALVPQRPEMAHRVRRPDQRGQAATRSRSMPLSRLYRHQPLGRARRHRRQCRQHRPRYRKARGPLITPASPRSAAGHPRRVLRRRAQLTTALKDQFCAGK